MKSFFLPSGISSPSILSMIQPELMTSRSRRPMSTQRFAKKCVMKMILRISRKPLLSFFSY